MTRRDKRKREREREDREHGCLYGDGGIERATSQQLCFSDPPAATADADSDSNSDAIAVHMRSAPIDDPDSSMCAWVEDVMDPQREFRNFFSCISLFLLLISGYADSDPSYAVDESVS